MDLALLDQFLTVVSWLLLFLNMASKRVNSVFLVCIVLVAYQSLSTIIRPLIINGVSLHDVENGRILYYFGFSFISIAAVVLLGRLHIMYALPVSFVSNFYARALQAIALIQVLRYIDRRSGADLLVYVYSHGIPALNLAAVIIVTHATGKLFYSRYKQNKANLC